VSRAAAKNPDRQRNIVKVAGTWAGADIYRMGPCAILVAIEDGKWHLTISRKDKLPSWEEVRDARYALVPDEVTMAMLLPPKDEYVNLHEYCLGLWQI
jgi:hypothetical protein